jgi:tRNA(adenine34) deaminase
MQDVAVAVLVDAGRVFIGKRQHGSRYEGVWEFPGGKVEPGETPRAALYRELREELGIEITDLAFVTSTEHRYHDGGHFRVWFFVVSQWHGIPTATQWETHAWVPVDTLEQYPLFEANRRVLPQLQQYLRAHHDEHFMAQALDQAERAAQIGEVPVGCVIAYRGRIIATAHNRTEQWNDATAHAELIAIREACRQLGTKWLGEGSTLYVTLEPCPMCAGAIVLARIERVVFGAADPKAGACETLYTITSDRRLNHRAAVRGGVLADRARDLLHTFFHQRRNQQ